MVPQYFWNHSNLATKNLYNAEHMPKNPMQEFQNVSKNPWSSEQKSQNANTEIPAQKLLNKISKTTETLITTFYIIT